MAGKIKQLVFAEGVTVTAPTEVDIVDTVNDQTIAGTKTFDEQIVLKEIATPTTPASGYKAVYPKADGKMYTLDDTGIETEIGSGSGGGGINYIDNPDAEGNVTTGWAVYADAAATTPVDGTGGTANITFTSSSSSPLRGTYSFLITKDAANRQGQGASYDFTIAAADKGRPLGIRWEGEASANYTGSSGTEYMVCYVYDVTNATVIATSNVNVPGGAFKGFTTFLATTSTSYRLIFHIAGTGTAAWTYKLDSVSVGPDTVVQGAAVSDPVSFTTTKSAGLGGSTETLWYARSGKMMQLWGSITVGTVAASAATLTLPTGLTVDSSYLDASGTARLGHFSTLRNASTALYSAGYAGDIYYNGTSTVIALDAYSVSRAYPGTNASGMVSTSDVIAISALIPIAEWSSNVTMANRAVEEFASNSSTATTGNNTTSFAYGSEGSLFYSLTAEGKRRVRFTTPILSTDVITIEVRNGTTGKWTPIQEALYKHGLGIYTIQNGVKYGIGRDVSYINDTDIDIAFGTYAYPNGTYGAAGAAWSTISSQSYYWRVRKVSGGAVVGFPVSTRNIVGDTSGTTVPSGYIGEKLSSTGSDVTPTTDQYTDGGNAGLTLNPGVYMLQSTSTYYVGTGSAVTTYICGIGTASGNSSTGMSSDNYIWLAPASHTPSSNQVFHSANWYVVVTTATTYYPKFKVKGTIGTGTVTSSLVAVRIA